MRNDKKLSKLEAAFDGTSPDHRLLQEMSQDDAECAAWLDHLNTLRTHSQQLRQQTPSIADEQFSAFFAGIQQEISVAAAPARTFRRGWWAVLSLSAAALLVAFSAFWVMTEGPQPVEAQVEAASTEMEGATVEWYDTEQGVPTVWVTLAEDDLL